MPVAVMKVLQELYHLSSTDSDNRQKWLPQSYISCQCNSGLFLYGLFQMINDGRSREVETVSSI